ncbi:hypothetical protein M408DRAFT_290655 [Serendipita vermifera MAFF 305830]|uniref:Uncharacterized protein n=1 Tax=Serendipita vermifera MAFF 305830 TaxID=933852 RepID=A0A0C3AT20_SERVB|nr:hypothetical protein M408DRAFT_290655 [Serendipita vermifera MAFF 305830]
MTMTLCLFVTPRSQCHHNQVPLSNPLAPALVHPYIPAPPLYNCNVNDVSPLAKSHQEPILHLPLTCVIKAHRHRSSLAVLSSSSSSLREPSNTFVTLFPTALSASPPSQSWLLS